MLACADRTTDVEAPGVFDSKQIKRISGFGMIKVAIPFCRELGLLLFKGPETSCQREDRWQWLESNPEWVYVDAGNDRYFALLSQVLRALPEADTKTRLLHRQRHANKVHQCDWVEAALAFLRSHWEWPKYFTAKGRVINALPHIASPERCALIP